MDDNLPTRAQIKAWLAQAERMFIDARNLPPWAMHARQDTLASRINDYKGRLARLEYRDVAGEAAA